MTKHLFWISSYPKSGNTLLRAIISSLFFSKSGLFDFKLLNNIPVIEDTKNLKFIKKNYPVDYKNINNLEVLSKHWLNIQTKKNLNFNGDFMFVKTHHALVKMYNNPFTIEENTRGIIYIVRDPRDVLISVSNHFDFSIKKSLENLFDQNFFLRWNDTPKDFLGEKRPLSYISSWLDHYLSWNNSLFNCPKLVLKFEDLVYDKKSVIFKLVDFFHLNYGFTFTNLEEKISNIIDSTEFNKLKDQEYASGFDESVNKNFFNIGKKNQWVDKLNKEDILKIERVLIKILKKHKYEIKYFNNEN